MNSRASRRKTSSKNRPAQITSSQPPSLPGSIDAAPVPGQFLWLGLILLMGGLLRFLNLSNISIEHFDEAIYASNLFFDAAEHFRYPDRHLYAPPLLPGLIEWSMMILGFSTFAVFLVNLFFGFLTVLLVWFVLKNWFGELPALVAATLCSLSDPHLYYTRTTLTDVPLCFWLCLAVFLWWRSVTRDSIRLAIVAGVISGLAWWTKYNGWLALAIAGSGALPWCYLERTTLGKPKLKRIALLYAVMTGTALLCWSPVYFGLADFGGYASVSMNHKKYFVGLSGWGNTFLQQGRNLEQLTSPVSGFGLAVACLILICSRTVRQLFLSRLVVLSTIVPVLLFWLGFRGQAPALLGGLSFLWLMVSFKQIWTTRNDQPGASSISPTGSLAFWLIAAWFFGLAVATPLYTPYPRLTLPWLMSCWLVVAVMTAQLLWCLQMKKLQMKPDTTTESGSPSPLPKRIPCLIMALLIACTVRSFLMPATFVNHLTNNLLTEPRTGLETIAAGILQECREQTNSQDSFVIYVYAEPGLFFHLRKEHEACGPAGNLSLAAPGAKRHTVPTYIVLGPHAFRQLENDDDWKRYHNEFANVKTWEYHPSRLVQLNHPPSKELADPSAPKSGDGENVTLLRLKTADK